MPNLIVIAGPNGAGKSTVAPALLQGILRVNEFVNADAIAQGLSAFAPERVAFQAGRIMLERLQQLANQQVNFAFETTLASRTFAPWIANLQQTGYLFNLIFMWLPSAEIAIA
ncbi:MAG: zeta toxin family protein [Phormidium sp.]